MPKHGRISRTRWPSTANLAVRSQTLVGGWRWSAPAWVKPTKPANGWNRRSKTLIMKMSSPARRKPTLALGQPDQAREYALKGYARGWADGWPYVDWWTLERSRRVLAALGDTDEAKIQAELGLTPFDESKVEPIPV